MRTSGHVLALSCLLLGCTEYKFHEAEAPGLPGEDSAEPDTSEPGSCDGWSPSEPGTAAVDEACINEPEKGTWTPVVEWQWQSNTLNPGYDDIMSTPAIANLTDDNGDGLVDADDIPDIVFTSFDGGAYSSPGALTAISGDGSGEIWSLRSVDGETVYSSGGVAIGDIDADGEMEVCTAGVLHAVVCVTGSTGALEWAAGTETHPYGAPAMADMDGDGLSEVIFGRQIFSHDGLTLGVGGGGYGGFSSTFAVDMDGDGALEVVGGNTAYEIDGTIMWSDGGSDGYAAVGDFNGDGRPDVVKVSGGQVTLTANDESMMWQVEVPGGGGGSPTVADFDGDGLPEIGVAGAYYYVVFDTDGTQLWANAVQDYSSSITGSSVFDFEGDGSAEVVYADELTLWVYDGATGAVELELKEHASGTLFEYPLIADVDADGSTEIVLASNNYSYSGWNGITVIGDAGNSWAPARPIWNQYGYHITNVEDDGRIPAVQQENWLTWNSFRAGGTLSGLSHWLSDVTPGDIDYCFETCAADVLLMAVHVQNTGLLDAAASQLTLQSDGDSGAVLHEGAVPPLLSGAEAVVGPIEVSRTDWGDGRVLLQLDSDDVLDECDEDNNQLDLGAWPCDAP